MIKLSSNGFTLVELLVTIILIGVVFTGLSSIFIGIQRIQVHTAYLDSATRAAQREIESLRNLNYNNLAAGTSIDFSGELPATMPAGSTGTVVVTEPSPGIKRLDVTVRYTYGGTTKNVQLSSLIGVIGIVT